jgi:hypothetical protein
MSPSPPERLLERIRAEYLEMQGWCLTLEQMQRLGSEERTLCKRVLDALVDAKLLCVTSDGDYCRLPVGEIPRPVAAKADIERTTVLQMSGSG